MKRVALGFFLLSMISVQEPHKLHYKERDGNWVSVTAGQHYQFTDDRTGGVRVELRMGRSGADRVEAILVRYDKFRNHRDLIAFDPQANIGLLVWDRWNQTGLDLSAPDADEILASSSVPCKSIDVARLLRISY